MKSRKQRVKDALEDTNLQTALKRSVDAYKNALPAAVEGFDRQMARRCVRSIKERCIDDLDTLFQRFKVSAETAGAVVHQAADGSAAAEIVKKLAYERGVKLVVKSKSTLTDEIELNPKLESAGIKVVETDLGEWIIQLAGDKPSHFTAPALHKTREQVAELFSQVTGTKVDSDISNLVGIARRELRQAFINADMGISGVNIAVAETGSIVVASNEGNARLVTTLPPIHVAIVGYEKIVETLDDANEIIKSFSRIGGAQKMTAYVSYITGPSRTTDIEKTLTLGVHGPKEVHIIFVDGGRKSMAADESCREALYCIKCGACLNVCPVFHSIGGHAYSNAYSGGIGAVWTSFVRDMDEASDTLDLCAGCGKCSSICPSEIDTPKLTLELKKRLVGRHGMSVTGKAPLFTIKHPGLFQGALKIARGIQSPFMDKDNNLRDLPIVSALIGQRKMPGLAPKFLREILPAVQGDKGSKTVSLYAGCVLDFVMPDVGESIWKVLVRGGFRALFPRDQACCGAPALYMGDFDTARKLAVDNILALENGSPDLIVTGCPTCAVMLKERFSQLLAGTAWEDRAGKVAEKVIDFSSFAATYLDLSPGDVSSVKAAYHAPCHLVRSLGVKDAPRELIVKCGCEYVEMEDFDECCGFAGSYSAKNSEISNSILERKINSIDRTGADILATDCPGCMMQIGGGLKKRGKNTAVRHIARLVAEMMDK